MRNMEKGSPMKKVHIKWAGNVNDSKRGMSNDSVKLTVKGIQISKMGI